MTTINNMNRVADTINALNLQGVNAVGDDGSVCIQVSGNEIRVREVATIINELSTLPSRVGDGVQEGGYWINSESLSDDLSAFLN